MACRSAKYLRSEGHLGSMTIGECVCVMPGRPAYFAHVFFGAERLREFDRSREN